MSGKAAIPLVIGLGVGGLAIKMVFDTVKKAQGAQATMVNVWGPGEEMARGTSIDANLLKAIAFPVKSVPAGAFKDKDKDKLAGRVLRTAAPAGLPITEAMLLPPGASPGLFVKPGFRAVSIKIDESSGVSNLLQPGQMVDVVGCFKVRRGNRQETISRTLIENVEVGAVGERLSSPAPAGKESKSDKGIKPARAVTLFIKPEDVAEVHLAEQRGKIKLSLRNGSDTDAGTEKSPITEGSVVGEEEQTETADRENNSLLDRVKQMFTQQEKAVQERLAKLEEASNLRLAAAGPAAASPLYTMVVVNGSERVVLGWPSLDSTEPIRLDGAAAADGPARRGIGTHKDAPALPGGLNPSDTSERTPEAQPGPAEPQRMDAPDVGKGDEPINDGPSPDDVEDEPSEDDDEPRPE